MQTTTVMIEINNDVDLVDIDDKGLNKHTKKQWRDEGGLGYTPYSV